MLGVPPPASADQPAWQLTELKAFLRARRAALAPRRSTDGERRRTPGLRREEVALEAGVGVSWYTWLEQGRGIRISPTALGRVARALHLAPEDEAYLFWLAGLPRHVPPVFEKGVSVPVQAMLDSHSTPAAVLDASFNLIATNAMARDLYSADSPVEPFPRNQMWQLLMNPVRRALYVDYEADLRHFVGIFRLTCASRLSDLELKRVVDALRGASPLFRRLWEECRTEPLAPRPVRLRHDNFGAISVTSVRLPLPSEDGGIIAFLEPADETTVDAFAHWSGRIGPAGS